MINPNIHKRIVAEVLQAEKIDNENMFFTQQHAIVNGQTYEINYRRGDSIKKPGRRYLYVNFSITSDRYYLTVN